MTLLTLSLQQSFRNCVVPGLDLVDRSVLVTGFAHKLSVSLGLPALLDLREKGTGFELLFLFGSDALVQLIGKAICNNNKSKVKSLAEVKQYVCLKLAPV